MISQENIEKILTLLSERLALSLPERKWDFLVCGGTALNALKLINRTTKDVDVIGVIKNKILVKAELENDFNFYAQSNRLSRCCHKNIIIIFKPN